MIFSENRYPLFGIMLEGAVIARSVRDEAFQIEPSALDCFAFGSQ
jgi:hypothetical protein